MSNNEVKALIKGQTKVVPDCGFIDIIGVNNLKRELTVVWWIHCRGMNLSCFQLFVWPSKYPIMPSCKSALFFGPPGIIPGCAI